jgi:hypothetical protein
MGGSFRVCNTDSYGKEAGKCSANISEARANVQNAEQLEDYSRKRSFEKTPEPRHKPKSLPKAARL